MAKTEMLGITPLADRVVVQPMVKEEKSVSGIIIPDTVNKEKPAKGTVVAVGPGRYTDEGKRIPMDVKVGDKVYFKKPWDEPIKINDIEYYILSESEITLTFK